MSVDLKTEGVTDSQPAGLGFWMACVPRASDRVRHDFAPDSVHDLGIVLRRCRSIADGLMALDPRPGN